MGIFIRGIDIEMKVNLDKIPSTYIDDVRWLIGNSESFIRNKDYDGLYQCWERLTTPNNQSIATSILYKSGIDPLLYMNEVPSYFLFKNPSISGEVIIPSCIKNINLCAFFRCPDITSVVIKGGVESIGSHAFENCKRITSVSIPDSVVAIQSGAFYRCNKLTEFFYAGTVEQWKEIRRGLSWDSYTGRYIVHCKDGDIHKGE